MRKILTAGLAALTLAGGVVGGSAPATAAPFHGGSFHGGGFRGGGFRGGFRGPGPVFAAGLFGIGLGAALAGPYYGYGYGPGPYYSDGYAYGPGYGTCVAPRQVWDPYAHRYVIERVSYAC